MICNTRPSRLHLTVRTLHTRGLKVAELYELMKKWHLVADQLPNLTERLLALDDSVRKSVHFAARLNAVDEEHTRLAQLIESNARLLEQVYSFKPFTPSSILHYFTTSTCLLILVTSLQSSFFFTFLYTFELYLYFICLIGGGRISGQPRCNEE